jgi:hypothetical protein
MINLNNNMSYVISEITHCYYPRKFVQFSIMLIPTKGSIAADPDEVPGYGINHMIYFGTDHEPERTTALSLIGKNYNTIRDWVLGEWGKYKTSLEYNKQLSPIFENITAVGIKT